MNTEHTKYIMGGLGFIVFCICLFGWFSIMIIWSVPSREFVFRVEMDENTKEAIQSMNRTYAYDGGNIYQQRIKSEMPIYNNDTRSLS